MLALGENGDNVHRKHSGRALAGVAQWTERGPANQMVAGSVPCQGTCLDCSWVPSVEGGDV